MTDRIIRRVCLNNDPQPDPKPVLIYSAIRYDLLQAKDKEELLSMHSISLDDKHFLVRHDGKVYFYVNESGTSPVDISEVDAPSTKFNRRVKFQSTSEQIDIHQQKLLCLGKFEKTWIPMLGGVDSDVLDIVKTAYLIGFEQGALVQKNKHEEQK